MATNCVLVDRRLPQQVPVRLRVRARLIENGELTDVVKKSNYRGISATFWRNLKARRLDPSTVEVHGDAQLRQGRAQPDGPRVGHASPTCLFADVSVFGGVMMRAFALPRPTSLSRCARTSRSSPIT